VNGPDPRLALRADCGSCAGLCCVVPAFAASTDFAIDKPSGVPCPHLATEGFGCTIHAELPERGFRGCTVYDCFGAGQRVVQQQYAGRDWRASPEVRAAMFADFEVVERLHELLWYLADALSRSLSRSLPRPLVAELEGLRDAVEAAAAAPGGVEVTTLQLRADPLLGEASAHVRRPAGASWRGRDLAGRDLRGDDLVASDLRGSVLIGADLRGADLSEADLLGADLRGADVRGADLAGALFLTRFQVAAAHGDRSTRLTDVLEAPERW
jgi:hypothetical protein